MSEGNLAKGVEPVDDARLVVSLSGGLANSGEVPAFTALESMHGLAQAAMMVIYYSQTGEIRRRKFKDLNVDFRLTNTREGSFEFIFEFSQFAPYLIDAYGKGLANASWELMSSVFRRVIGFSAEKRIEDAEGDGRLNAGDIGALEQAVEPAIRKAHSVINHGASSVNIYVEGNENKIIFNTKSKEYLHENIFNDEVRSQRFLVTSYDGRNRTGRLFDLEDEQAYTFELLAEANRHSLVVLVDAARAYALRQKGKFDEQMEVVCVFTSVDAPDGRKKRLKVFAAAKDFNELDTSDLPAVSALQPLARRLSPPLEDDDLLE